jgi:hypothetical protein
VEGRRRRRRRRRRRMKMRGRRRRGERGGGGEEGGEGEEEDFCFHCFSCVTDSLQKTTTSLVSYLGMLLHICIFMQTNPAVMWFLVL